MDLSVFEAGLVYIENSRSAMASQRLMSLPASPQQSGETPGLGRYLHHHPDAPTSRSGVPGSPRPALTEGRGGRRSCQPLGDSAKAASGNGVPSSGVSGLGAGSQVILGSKGCWSSCMLELSMVVEAAVEGPGDRRKQMQTSKGLLSSITSLHVGSGQMRAQNTFYSFYR